MSAVSEILSVNVGIPRPTDHSDVGVTAIDKRATTEPVRLRVPAARGGSGLTGDALCDDRFHGGPDQAVYAYAREDLDHWAAELERELPPGVFGENLTTAGFDVTGAVLGERWRIGHGTLLEVTAPRIPCRTFAGWIGTAKWVKTGDPIEVLDRPDHGVTVELAFRALTTDPDLRERLLAVHEPAAFIREKIQSWETSQPA